MNKIALSAKQIKSIMAKARLIKAGCHIGMNGLQPDTLAAFIDAFNGTCIRPTPCDIVRVKIQNTFKGDIEKLIQELSEESGAVFVKKDGNLLVFWKPTDEMSA